MSYSLFVDSGSNLPARKLQEFDIHVIPFSYEMDGKLLKSPEYPDGFDGHHYYTRLKEGAAVKTSLINSAAFYEAFRPAVAGGNDVMYVGISSGISGTVQSALMAAQQLMEDYPACRVRWWTPWAPALAPAFWPARRQIIAAAVWMLTKQRPC